MRVAVTGATGLIGKSLVRELLARGDSVAALTRDRARARHTLGDDVEHHEWPDPVAAPPPAAAIEGADAVVNLLGEPVAQRWTPEAKRGIRDSRVLGTQQLVAGIRALAEPRRPGRLISGSAVGYYGPRGDEPIDEQSGPGDDFLAGVTVQWEHAAQAAPDPVRVVLIRTGVVLASEAGALRQMLPPFRLGVGGPVGGGRQYVPWIHLGDVIAAIRHLLDDPGASGPVNLTAPEPVRNRELSRALGRVLHRPAVMPVPGVALKLLYGEMSQVVLTGQRALPARLLELGFEFEFARLEGALQNLLGD